MGKVGSKVILDTVNSEKLSKVFSDVEKHLG